MDAFFVHFRGKVLALMGFQKNYFKNSLQIHAMSKPVSFNLYDILS